MARFVERTLSNGLRICLEPMPHMRSAAAGFLVRTGARDETAIEEGVSHFLEHMCFKGTPTRTWEEVNQTFDRLGATYNAYTSEEKTFYYGWVPAENLLPQVTLLADMMHSAIPADEFETEKKVILEEIAMYRDSLESCMFDLARKQLMPDSPLSQSVLGTPDTIEPLTRDQMLAYQARRYCPENMVFVGSGLLDIDVVVAHVEAVTAGWPAGDGGRLPQPCSLRRGIAREKNGKFKQQAMMLCYPAPPASANDPRLTVLNGILADDNSRIFWEIIQQGLCPRAGSFCMDWSDLGVEVLYALCEPEKADTVLAALREQAEIMTRKGPTDFEVERVKNQIRTSLARDGDAPYSRLQQLAEDIDLLNRPLSLDEHLARLAAVTVADVRRYMEEYPITGEGMLVSVGPADWPA